MNIRIKEEDIIIYIMFFIVIIVIIYLNNNNNIEGFDNKLRKLMRRRERKENFNSSYSDYKESFDNLLRNKSKNTSESLIKFFKLKEKLMELF